LNEFAEAEKLQREALETGRQVLGADTLTVANLLNGLGVTVGFLGRYSEAEGLFRESYQTYRSLVGERHWRTAKVARNVARSLALQRRFEEGLAWMDQAIAALSLVDPADRPNGEGWTGFYGMRAQRAMMLFRLGRRQEGITQAEAAVADLEPLRLPNTTRQLLNSRVILGRMLNESGRPRDAEPILAAALAGLESLGPQHPLHAEAVCELTRARLLQAPSPADRERLDECLAIFRNWGLAEPEVIAALETLRVAHPRERIAP
jgi:tetratricopeptide (TPR) repeat protein